MDKGLSKEDAEKFANDRIKKEKIIGIAAGITLAAAATYIANKKIREQCDSVIRKGSKLQRIELKDPEGKVYDQFYGAKNKADKFKYAGMLGMQRKMQGYTPYKMKIGVNSNIKVAGRRNALKTFEKLYNNDSEFKEAVTPKYGSKLNIKELYDKFNAQMYDYHTDTDLGKSIRKFTDSLKSKGYGAVQDVNDVKFSGYKAKNPLIIFGHQGKVAIESVKKMTDEEINKKFNVIKAVEKGEEISKRYGSAIPLAAAPIVPLVVAKTKIKEDQKIKSKIESYKNDTNNKSKTVKKNKKGGF